MSGVLNRHTRRLRRHLKISAHFAISLYNGFAEASKGPEDFVRQLHYSRDRKATDPRDYVFAQLGHPSAQKASNALPILGADYGKTVAEVFRDATIRILEEAGGLDILNTVQHRIPNGTFGMTEVVTDRLIETCNSI